jgi:serine/threonine protein kinase
MPNSSDASESALADLVSLWQRHRAEGRTVTLGELCRDCPELLSELEQRIAALEQMVDLGKPMCETVALDPAAASQAAPDPADASQRRFPTLDFLAPSGEPAPANWPVIPGYELLAELGRGGMGVVYKARHTHLNRLVALKMVLHGVYSSPDSRARFRAEAEAVARLHHPHIVQVFSWGEHSDLPFLVMEFVDGGSLDQRIARRPQPPGDSARVMMLLARAVHATHKAGIVHRDLKPANVLLASPADEPALNSAYGWPKIGDFGLARLSGGLPGLTASFGVLGTPQYMAPEQAAGKTAEVGTLTDIYALGAILYELLTGHPPFRGQNQLETLEQVKTLPPRPPHELCPDVPPVLEALCLRCLAKTPEERPATAADLAEDLRRYLEGQPVALGLSTLVVAPRSGDTPSTSTRLPIGATTRTKLVSTRRYGIAAMLLLLVAAIIIVVVHSWHPFNPVHLVLIGPGYKTNLFVPHNVSGHNGAKQLKQIHEQNKWGDHEDVFQNDFGTIKAALEPLHHTITRFWKAKTAVLFVSAHGVARFEDGGLTPYLVPHDADLHPKSTLYPLKSLLDQLGELPSDTPKLLLLDVTQVSAHWPLGELHNDFARALALQAEHINKIPNLVVISSSDVDQRSWVSPEWGQTYFAHFVSEGLKGAADGVGKGSKKNGRVDAMELFNFVSNEVQRWVRHNRARLQTPVKFGDDDRARKLELVTYKDYKADNNVPAEEKHEEVYGELKKAWEKCERVREEWPHPAVYAPHLWRRYLDMLLRAEQLLRAGDTAAVENLLMELNSLHQRIENSRSLELKSTQLTLAMPAALGVALTEGEQKKLETIVASWDKKEAEKDEIFKDWEKESPLRRAALAGELMRNVAKGPKLPYTLRPALEKIDAAAAECRPAEVHYLMMLCPEVAGTNPSPIDPLLRETQSWPLVQQSLRVRLLAEQAALGLDEKKDGVHLLLPYSEQVLPWIREMVEKADVPRRLGQDLLFASTTKEWDEAKKHLNLAERDYREVQKRAIQIRRALEVRDRAHSELPYYTHWVAEDGSEHEELVKKLWHDLHDLDHQLDDQTAKLDRFDDLHDSITKDFEELESAFLAGVRKEKSDHQARWHQIEAALTVPFLPAEDRMKLIQDSHDVSKTLFEKTPKEGNAENSGGEREHKQARLAAQRQGRLARSALGDDWPESADIQKELGNATEESWRNALTSAGEHVGRLLNRLPEETDARCRKAADSEDEKTADKELRSAVRNARVMEGAAVDLRMKRNPIEEKRRLDWCHLLSWQAQRTYLDWWAELKPGKEHYYQRAAKIFLDDAEALVKSESANPNDASPNARLMVIQKQREKLSKSLDVVVKVVLSANSSDRDFRAGPTLVNLSDEPDGLKRYYRLFGPDAKEVPGAPVLWVDVDTQPKAQSALQVPDEERERKRVDFGSPHFYPSKIAVDHRREPLRNSTTHHVVHCFFRGHHSELRSEVIIYSKPNVTLNMPLKSGGGSVAVQTSKSLYELFGAKKNGH